MNQFWRFALSCIAAALLTACQIDANILEELNSKVDKTVPSLVPSQTNIYSGESLSLTSMFNPSEVAGITFSSPDGYYDSNTNSLIIPKNLNSRTVQLLATNEDGGTQNIPIKIDGLDESFIMETPQTYGDQNYPEAGTKLANGTMLFGSTYIDSAGGWEWTAIYRSTNNGSTWSIVDNYQPYDNGEAHILAMTSQGNNAYYCGYQWDSDGAGTAYWVVRRSTDGGTTWTTVALDSDADDSVCQTLSVSPTTGYLYAGGFDRLGSGGNPRGILRESRDQGQTWSNIYAQEIPGGYNVGIMHAKVAPDNTIWMIGTTPAPANAILLKGTFSGAWNFVDMNVNFGSANATNYQTFGELTIVDSNTAFLNSRFGNTWNIKKTTNGGVSWSNVFDYGSRTDAGELEILSNGTIVAMGTYHPPGFGPSDVKVARSTDGGTTWSVATVTSGKFADGCLLFKDNAGDIHSINSAKDNATHFTSNDGGATWVAKDYIIYTEKFYNEISKFLVLPSGNYFTIGFANDYSKTTTNHPWFTGMSSDKGKTWIYPDLFTDPSDQLTTYDVAYDQLGNIFVFGIGETSFTSIIRKSSDNGQTWSTKENYVHPTYPAEPVSWMSKGRLVVDKNNIPYHGAAFYNVGTNTYGVEIRKGDVGGENWSTVKTFPLNGAYKGFSLVDFTVSSNNTLWLSSKESNTSSQPERALYKSTDGGVTWTEVLRESNTTDNPYVKIGFDSSGAVYLQQLAQILKSTDGGTSWSALPSTGNIQDILITTDDKVFVLTTDNQLKKLQPDSSWLLINDITDKAVPQGRGFIYYSQTVGLVQLSPTTVGLQVRFAEAKKGTVELMKTISINH
ncbi:sialidase family protein [Bdellovibrio sp. NC01]|uniref:sialidase family protein n=1 Tax=Bdellovibrio sp. NC01 TaxID=2220073 RepID=UPI001157944D|nr:sialidase family protein [Bdellovibrio sp. NC01]QDK37221.1 hypothetical protein DOE51_06265 [Bdellovibrio sp. NC01]